MSNLNELGRGSSYLLAIPGGAGGYFVAKEMEGNVFPDYTDQYENLAEAADQANITANKAWQEYSTAAPGKGAELQTAYRQHATTSLEVRERAEDAQHAQLGYEGSGVAVGMILAISLTGLTKHLLRRRKAYNA